MSRLWKPRYRIPGGPTDPSAWDSFYDDATRYDDWIVLRPATQPEPEDDDK